MEYIKPKAEQLDILKKIPQAQQTGEIKRDIKELEKNAFGTILDVISFYGVCDRYF